MADDRRDGLRGFARNMRSAPTDAERIVWRMLRAGRLEGLKFKRQVPIGPYIADFASFRFRLIIELDGYLHEGAAEYDAARDRWFEAQGFKVLRFSNLQAKENVDAIAKDILRMVEDRRIGVRDPSPSHCYAMGPSLPRKGGGEGP